MSENISLGGEISFFGDRSFHTNESAKNNKDITKNSSDNPEKIYDKLNSEIKKFTENGKDSSYYSSNSNSKNPINERLYDSKYWRTLNKDDSKSKEESCVNFNIKYENLKKKLSNTLYKNSFSDEFDSLDLEEDTFHNQNIINQVSSIKIQSNNFANNSIINDINNKKFICMSKQEEIKDDNKDEEINENIENSNIGYYQNYFTKYKARIPNYDSKFSIPNLYNLENNLINIPENNNKFNNTNIFLNKQNLKRTECKNENKSEKQLINIDDIISGKDKRTTVMIRNIPIKYNEKMLVNALNDFEGKYDFLYLPFDYEKGGNKGYAFINFNHSYHILLFHEKFQNKKWNYFESKKICELNIANFQGINDIQKHVKNYKGVKKNTVLKDIEEPLKYLNKIKIKFPKMIYSEKKDEGVFVIKSFE